VPRLPTVFDEIRAGARRVAERSRHVRIDRARLSSYAEALPAAEIEKPALDPSAHLLGRGEATAAYFVVLDSVNFGSGWFPVLRKRPGCSGYFTIARSLKDDFERNGPPSTARLRTMTPRACAALFGQPEDDPELRDLLELLARALRDLGALLDLRFGGSVAALVESAGRSAARLVRTLAEMALYRDVSEYAGMPVPFFKRAQLTCADLWLAFGGSGPGRFDDVDDLTIFADNLVPHVLRFDGVLLYDADLAARIDAGVLVPAQSAEEIEIRACAVAAVEELSAELARLGRPCPPRHLDTWLWNRGARPEIKAVPRHRTRTPFY
jgi:hypothetical protein